MLTLCVLAFQTQAGHYFFSGPASSFMVEGTTVGQSTSGLPFTLALTDNGSKIAPTEFDLKGPMWDHAVHVKIADAKFAGGHLTGKAQFKNESGKVLEGLRLDLVSATDTYTDGNDTKTRTEAAAIASPILFADLQIGDDADPEDVDVSGLTFSPTTKQVNVTFKLSGLAYLGSFKPNDNLNAGALSVDSQGRVYVVDHNSGLWRVDPDGTHPQQVAKWGDSTDYALVNPSTGELIGHEMNSHRVIVYGPGGDEKYKVPALADFDRWPQWARMNGAGDLYVAEENHICIYKAGNKVKDVETIDGHTLADGGKFEVTSDGTLFMPSEGSIYQVDPSLSTAKKILFGPDWHLGRITNVATMRADSAGNLYVLEGNAENFAEWPRVSVFDKSGHFVRVFGRAGKAPRDGDTLAPGAIGKNLYDVAFGKDGRVYVTSDIEFGSVLMFMPF